MRYLHLSGILAALLLAAARPAAADLTDHPAESSVVAQLEAVAQHKVTLLMVLKQNERHQTLGDAQLERLDAQWREEVDAAEQPLIGPVLGSPLSGYLTRVQAHAGGLFTSLSVSDARGLAVGQSTITGHYWQGNERSWRAVFEGGDEGIVLDSVAEDPATGQAWQRLRVPVRDPDTQEPIGVVTAVIDMSELGSLANAQAAATHDR